MDSQSTNEPTRNRDHGWSVLVSGDDGHELRQYIVDVSDFIEAARKANEISALIVKYKQADYVQLTLRGWRIEITMSAPTGTWWSKSQKQLCTDIQNSF